MKNILNIDKMDQHIPKDSASFSIQFLSCSTAEGIAGNDAARNKRTVSCLKEENGENTYKRNVYKNSYSFMTTKVKINRSKFIPQNLVTGNANIRKLLYHRKKLNSNKVIVLPSQFKVVPLSFPILHILKFSSSFTDTQCTLADVGSFHINFPARTYLWPSSSVVGGALKKKGKK